MLPTMMDSPGQISVGSSMQSNRQSALSSAAYADILHGRLMGQGYTSGYNTSSYPSSRSSMSMPSSSMALYPASMYPSSLAPTNMMAAQNSMSSSLSPSVQYELALQSAMARTSAYHNAYSSLSNEELLATNRLDASQSYLAASADANNNVVPSLPPLGRNNPILSSSSCTARLPPLNPTVSMLSEASAGSSSMLGNDSNHSYTLGTSSSLKNNNTTATSPKAALVSRQSSDTDNSEVLLPSHYNHRVGMSNDNMNHPVRLVVPTDTTFLDSVHIFLRSHCIEIFVASPEDMTYPSKCRKRKIVCAYDVFICICI